MLKSILNLIYPRKCIFCKTILDVNKTKSEYICENCVNMLPFVSGPLISRKNKDIYDNLYDKTYYFKDCISSFYYETPISQAICNFKFNNKVSFVSIFSDYMFRTIVNFYKNINFDLITYIPMYKSKEKDRGYNQSKLLAKELSKKLKIPISDLLIKTKNNEPQHSLSLKDREINIKGVYGLLNKKDIHQKTILIIDDIITSGYTLNEAAKVLKLNGAKNVYCATIATTKLKNQHSLFTYLINQINNQSPTGHSRLYSIDYGYQENLNE